MRAYIAQLRQHISKRIEFERLLIIVRYYGIKVLLRFPEGKWLSYQEVVALGCPEQHAKLLVGFLLHLRRLEARVSLRDISTWPEELQGAIELELSGVPFDEAQAELFEYRIRHDDTPASDEQHDPLHVPAFALGC
jgi:hypothetical protein